MGIIYALRCKITGKVYIGQTVKSLTERWQGHLDDARRGSRFPIHAAIRKYGAEAFTQEIVWEGNSEYLNPQEILCIRLVDSTNSRKGYNLTPGGNHVHKEKLTEAHRKAISRACTGLKRSEATKERMRQAKLLSWKDPQYRDSVLHGIRQPHKKNRVLTS